MKEVANTIWNLLCSKAKTLKSCSRNFQIGSVVCIWLAQRTWDDYIVVRTSLWSRTGGGGDQDDKAVVRDGRPNGK